MDFTAKLIQIMPPITGEGKNGTWKRQEYIFETESQYPRKICVSVWGDKGITDMNIMKEGNVLNVSFDLESREFNGRWYTDIRAWRIQLPGASAAQTPAQGGFNPNTSTSSSDSMKPQTPQFPTPSTIGEENNDDLPF
ncbi:MAG: DUF3127 domain-containing protein [Bacteroidales bacterium]